MFILDTHHPKTPSRVYSYNLSTKTKKLVKEQEIPSGHNPEDYIVERVELQIARWKISSINNYKT